MSGTLATAGGVGPSVAAPAVTAVDSTAIVAVPAMSAVDSAASAVGPAVSEAGLAVSGAVPVASTAGPQASVAASAAGRADGPRAAGARRAADAPRAGDGSRAALPVAARAGRAGSPTTAPGVPRTSVRDGRPTVTGRRDGLTIARDDPLTATGRVTGAAAVARTALPTVTGEPALPSATATGPPGLGAVRGGLPRAGRTNAARTGPGCGWATT
jgi:hypothetical protein